MYAKHKPKHMFPNKTASELSTSVRTMLIPRGIAAREAAIGATLKQEKIHPNVDLSTVSNSSKGLLEFTLPAGDDERFFQIVMDEEHSAAAVVFGRVGLGNHGAAEIHIGNTTVFCGETAFVLRRLSFMYEKARDDHFCEVWDNILKANTPHGCQGASRALHADLFKGKEWDEDSKDQMFSTLLLKYTSDAKAYEYFKELDDLLSTKHIGNVCFVEVGDNKIWASGVSGEKTVEALLKLKEINPGTVAEVVSKLGGQNKLGQAYDLLYDAFMAAKSRTFESFTTFVQTELPALYAKPCVEKEGDKEEVLVEEPPTKRSRSMA